MLTNTLAAAAPQPTKTLVPARSDAEFQDTLRPLTPRVERTEEDQDRLTSATLYAYGRILYQRRDFEGALRKYQRAWRYNPDAVSILSEIVPLATALDRRAEAARYAAIAVESDPSDSRLLMGLAAALSEQGDYTRALKLYETALELESKGQPGVASVLMWMEAGRLYFLTEQFEKAANSFAQAREAIEEPNKLVLPEEVRKRLLGDPERTYLVMAECFLRANRWDEAEQAFRKALASDDKRPLLDVQLARVELERKEIDKALEHLAKYFQSKSTEAGTEPYELLQAALGKQHSDDADARAATLTRLRDLQKHDSKNASLGYFLAEQLVAADKLDEAAPLLEALLADEPTLGGYESLIELNRRRKDATNLANALGKAVAFSADLQAIEVPVEKLAKDKSFAGEVLNYAQSAVAGDQPPPAGVAMAAAYLALVAERTELLDEFTNAALKSTEPPPGDAAVDLALEFLRMDQWDRAAALLQRAIDEKLKPEANGVINFYRSGALALSKRIEEATAAAQAAATANPDSPDFAQRVAWVQYLGKQDEQAEAAYIDFVDKFDGNHDAGVREVLREARLVLSNICVRQKRMHDAEEWLEQVLDEFPEDVGALNDLGYLWVDQSKHLQRGLLMIQQAVEAEPENKAYRDSLGWAYYRLGRFDQAVNELKVAADTDDPDGVILDHLGDAYLKLGQPDQAVETWRRAVESFERDDDTKQADATRVKLTQQK